MARKDAFLKIDGIPGQSTDTKHEGWIEVENYSHGLTQPGAFSSGGEFNAGRVEFQTFHIVKGLDKATPLLRQACCKGDRIAKMEFVLCSAAGNKHVYMKYTFESVVVTSISDAGFNEQKEGGLPVEHVTFAFGKIKWEFTPTKPGTNNPDTAVSTSWDRNTNTAAK